MVSSCGKYSDVSEAAAIIGEASLLVSAELFWTSRAIPW